MKIYLKEGLQLYDIEGNLWEIEDGDYTVINDTLIYGNILNSDLIRSIIDLDKQDAILELIQTHGEVSVVETFLNSINLHGDIDRAASDTIDAYKWLCK